MTQLPLKMPHEPAMGRDDFFVSACNHAAVDWIDRWPQWPACALIIYGDAGCGKTHLARLWQSRAGAAYVSGKNLDGTTVAPLIAATTPVVVDDAGAAEEEALFHLYNAVFNAKNRSLLLTLDRAPNFLPLRLADLRSRMLSVPAVAIPAPQEDELATVLLKQLHDRQMPVDADVIHYIVPRMERSFSQLRRLVEQLDHHSLAHQRRLTVPLARQVLDVLRAADEGAGA